MRNYKLLASLTALFVIGTSMMAPSAEARLLFSNEDDYTKGDSFTIDFDNNADSEIELRFGSDASGGFLRWNAGSDTLTTDENFEVLGSIINPSLSGTITFESGVTVNGLEAFHVNYDPSAAAEAAITGDFGLTVAEVDLVSEALDELWKKMATLSGSSVDLTDIENRLDTLSGEIISNDADIIDIYNLINSLSGDIASLSGQVAINTTNINTNTTNITNNSNDITNLSNDVTNLSGNVTNIENIVNTLSGDVASLSGQVATNTTNINTNTTNINNNATDITNLGNDVTTNTTNINILSGQLAALSGVVDALDPVDILALSGLVQQNIVDIQNLSGDVANNTTAINNLTTSVATNTTNISTNTTNIANNAAAIDDLSGQIAAGTFDLDITGPFDNFSATGTINDLLDDLDTALDNAGGIGDRADSIVRKAVFENVIYDEDSSGFTTAPSDNARGTMRGENDADGNHYFWRSNRGNEQSVTVVASVTLPEDFKEFAATNAFEVDYDMDNNGGASEAAIEVDVTNLAGTSLVSGPVSLANSLVFATDNSSVSLPTTGLTPGQEIYVKFRMAAQDGDTAKLYGFTLNYISDLSAAEL